MESIIGKEYPRKVIPLIDNAKNSIKIVVFDWRWYSDDPGNPCQLFNQSIVRARKRGVEVRACVNSALIAEPLKLNGVDVRIPISKNLMHTKMIIIDENTLILGSHNFSQNAFTFNLETSIIIKDDKSIFDFVSFFNSLWGV